MKPHALHMTVLSFLFVLGASAASAKPNVGGSPAKAAPAVGQAKPIEGVPGNPTQVPGCGAGCDWCWCDTPFENDCDPAWEDDGECDCCCQFPDTSDCGGGGGCQVGEIEDCNGNCCPDWWLGDGDCDQGQWTYNGIPIYLNCAAMNCDNGDCSPAECTGGGGCAAGEIEDCNGNCAPESWLGDNDCDHGQWTYNNIPIFFSCPELNCDNGDCPGGACGPSACPPGEVEDCHGACAPITWVGDAECDHGQWSYGGLPIFFNCMAFDCDNGDCPLDVCHGGCPLETSNPPNCAIDARQPHDMYNPVIRYGWDFADLTFDCTLPPLTPSHFIVSQHPAAPAAPPTVVNVLGLTADTVRVQFSGPINPGCWTCLQVKWNSGLGNAGCFGYLPADANASLQSGPPDIIAVIDHINGVIPRPIYGVDMDRSTVVDPSDIIRVIDLLNGAGAFAPWMNATLPPCPSP